MKNLIRLSGISAMMLLLSFVCPPRGIYEIKIKNTDGETAALSSYYGRKMVFVVLSGNETDAQLDELAAFRTKYRDSASVFGILSIEDGYSEAKKDQVKKRYKGKIPGLFLTEGMYTRKASTGQSELMQWFTHVEQNRHYGQEITGPGWKFFVDEIGEMYAAMNPGAMLTSPVIQRVMSKPARKIITPPPPMQKRQENKKG
jgi:glutathione peroxidase